jgi:hypothetical protein
VNDLFILPMIRKAYHCEIKHHHLPLFLFFSCCEKTDFAMLRCAELKGRKTVCVRGAERNDV